DDYVAHLYRNHPFMMEKTRIPPCWWKHPDLAWPLATLAVAFNTVYSAKVPPGLDQVSYYLNIFYPMFDRFNNIITGNITCYSTTHPQHYDPGSFREYTRDADLNTEIRNLNNEGELFSSGEAVVASSSRPPIAIPQDESPTEVLPPPTF